MNTEKDIFTCIRIIYENRGLESISDEYGMNDNYLEENLVGSNMDLLHIQEY